MIDLACVFTTGGVVLFYKTFCNLKFDAVDVLIKKVLVQDKGAETQLFLEPYMVKWKVANDLNLIFAIVYQEIFHLLYIEDLLDLMRNEFRDKIYPQIVVERNFYKNVPAFDKEFAEVIKKWELKQQKNQRKEKIMRSFQDTDKGKKVKGKSDEPTQPGNKKKKKEDKNEKEESEEESEEEGSGEESPKEEETQASSSKQLTAEEKQKAAIAKLKSKSQAKLTSKKSLPNMLASTPKAADKTPEEKVQKQKTTWGTTDKISSSKMNSLDFSSTKGGDDDVEAAKKQYLGDAPDGLEGQFIAEDASISEESDEDDDDENDKNKKPQSRGLLSRFTSSIKNVTGNMVLTAEDLNPMLAKFKEGLIGKNVAEEIAEQICNSIRAKLVDTKTKAFTSISKTIKEAFVESLTKILTPKKNIDVIAEAMRAKEKGKPYVICFIGINGVGKSTNLAKVAHLLKTKGGFSVMLAACDNFRAGAVEQIKTHGRCLEVPVYEKGYKNDPAIIASEAIAEAVKRKMDCVLIDTAGRMQDNEPLMKALARLVALNQPDLCIFVGEALVGNDAVDQLTKFNKALIDLSPPDRVREIDAILLTKFDTVDDKVGAAVSMTYATGKPVLFVGTGQKYTHMRKLNVKTVVHSLLH